MLRACGEVGMLDEMADLSKRPASDSTASCSRRDQRAWEL